MQDFVSQLSAVLLAGALLLPISGWAQDNSANAPTANEQTDRQGEDPPARVGRLAYFEGDVSQFGQDQDDWSEAQLNFPVTGNTAFATGANGRAEFELSGAVVRIGNGTELDIVALDEQNTDLRLPQGIAAIYLSPAAAAPVRTVITTPRGDVALSAPGRYFVGAGTEDHPTIVTVYEGGAQITDAAGAARLGAADRRALRPRLGSELHRLP